MSERPSYVLVLSCPDRVGVVASVTGYLADRGANVLEAQHFRDELSNRSVMRIVFELTPAAQALEAISMGFGAVAQRLQITWQLHDMARRTRVLVAVSKQGHCLNSLLHRWSVGSLSTSRQISFLFSTLRSTSNSAATLFRKRLPPRSTHMIST